MPRYKMQRPDQLRENIDVRKAIRQLQEHASGVLELSPTQVKAIEILLRKTLPDLSAIDAMLTGELVQYVVSDEPMSTDEWESKYCLEAPGRTSESLN